MKPADILVWERVLAQYPTLYASVDYDFPVGRGAAFLPEDESSADGRENRLYKYKIDAVGYNPDRIEVIEIKPDGSMKALGQALATKQLFEEQEKPAVPVIACVACGTITDDMRRVYESEGVKTILAPSTP